MCLSQPQDIDEFVKEHSGDHRHSKNQALVTKLADRDEEV